MLKVRKRACLEREYRGYCFAHLDRHVLLASETQRSEQN